MNASLVVGLLLLTLALAMAPPLSAEAAAATAAAAGGSSGTASFAPCSWGSAAAFDAAVEHFSKLLQFKTVSDDSTPTHTLHEHEFLQLNEYIASTYSTLLQHMQVEHLGAHNLSWLMTWPGSDQALKPVLFISHVDVVPVDDESGWLQPPFSGAVADGYIWGRGTLDIKIGVVGLLEAASALIAEGFRPQRTLLFAFGHDEEVGGSKGAAAIARALTERGLQLEMIWDEGSVVLSDGFPPLAPEPFALVGTSEKRYQTVQIALHSKGGHSSMPPAPDRSSIAARLGRFFTSLTSSPAPPRLVSPTKEFVAGLAAVAPWWLGPVLVAAKTFPVVGNVLAAVLASMDATTAAMVRDTAAVTHVAAGVADNVLPQLGTVGVNFRLLPGSTPETAVGYVKTWLGPDAAHANISLDESSPPVPVTDCDGPHFGLVKAAVQQVWQYSKQPDDTTGSKSSWLNAVSGQWKQQQQQQDQQVSQPVTVLPFLMPGGTDSKHYAHLTDAILRFVPYSASSSAKDLERIHGTNERISLGDYARALCTYRIGLKLAGAGSLPANAAEAQVATAAAAAAAAVPAVGQHEQQAAAVAGGSCSGDTGCEVL